MFEKIVFRNIPRNIEGPGRTCWHSNEEYPYIPAVSGIPHCIISIYTLFFLQTHHILPPIFSCKPTIFSEYSRNIPTETLPHTLVEQKNGAFEGEKGSPNAFLRDLSARNLSRMRNQQSTQLISCLDIINTKWNRQTAGICGKLQCGILETAGICGNSRFGI